MYLNDSKFSFNNINMILIEEYCNYCCHCMAILSKGLVAVIVRDVTVFAACYSLDL